MWVPVQGADVLYVHEDQVERPIHRNLVEALLTVGRIHNQISVQSEAFRENGPVDIVVLNNQDPQFPRFYRLRKGL